MMLGAIPAGPGDASSCNEQTFVLGNQPGKFVWLRLTVEATNVIPMEMAAKIIFANCRLCALGLVAEEGGASSACYHGNKFRQDDGNKYEDLVFPPSGASG